MWIERVGTRVVAAALFIGIIAAVKWAATGAVDNAGAWIAIPIIAAIVFICWLWERRSQSRRDRAG